jgi:hypothetical protein
MPKAVRIEVANTAISLCSNPQMAAIITMAAIEVKSCSALIMIFLLPL